MGTKKPNALGLYDMLGNVWEHCLEPYAPPDPRAVLRGGGWNSPRKEVRFANRQKVLGEEWNYSDPFRPIRMWWIPDARFVGFRIVELPDDGVGAKERERLKAAVKITRLKILYLSKGERKLTRVEGALAYAGNRTVDDLEILVHYFDKKGKPLLEDPKAKPAFRRCFPVLVNSAIPGDHRRPLKPNGSRTFVVDVPHPVDHFGPLDVDKLGTRVTRIHFARE